MADRRCPSRHRTCWIIGDSLAWCYQCGAIRSLRPIGPGQLAFSETSWTYPTGPGGENPAVVQYIREHRKHTVAPVGSLGY